jgi:ABC-type glutathione transport system ATPase component
MSQPIIQIKSVTKDFSVGKKHVRALNQVSLDLYPGKVLGLVGESGSGKSTLGKMLVMLEKPTSGTIDAYAQNLLSLNYAQKLSIYRKIQIIFQNPYSALNLRMTLRQILNEPMDIHQVYLKDRRESRLKELLERVALKKDDLNKYPHEFSGGQRQRICIARALSIDPEFIVCDEPLSALDVSIQAQIINLLRNCQKELNLGMLFISHDLAAVDAIADEVAVLLQGSLVEQGEAAKVFSSPKHPYTKKLIECAL